MCCLPLPIISPPTHTPNGPTPQPLGLEDVIIRKCKQYGKVRNRTNNVTRCSR